MNLFQQILSVSKEFREHFEKENQQEERLKAVEEMMSGGGGGGGSIPDKWQRICLKLKSNSYSTSEYPIEKICCIGDDLVEIVEHKDLSSYYLIECNVKRETFNGNFTYFMRVSTITDFPSSQALILPSIVVPTINGSRGINEITINADDIYCPTFEGCMVSTPSYPQAGNFSIYKYDDTSYVPPNDFGFIIDIEMYENK